ncbi:MAG: ABC transporter ATP-binding protein [Bacillota bacterium]|nr:ABC transporter ATP-binding protein [Bacillota bacterium]
MSKPEENTREKAVQRVVPDRPMHTVRRLFSYYRYYKLIFFIGLLLIILSSASQIAANGMLSPIIDTMMETGDIRSIGKYMIIMIVLVIVISVSQYLGNLFMARTAQRIVHQIRGQLFIRIQKLPVSFHDKRGHGDIMSTFTNDMELLTQSLEQSVSQIIISLVTVLGTFVMMLVLSPIMTLVVVLMLALMMLVVRTIAKRSGKNYRTRQAATADMNSFVEEMISAQRVVKVFNYEERATQDFLTKTDSLRESSTSASTYGVMMMPVMGNLTFVMYALIAIGGGILAINNRMTIGNIAAFLQYTRTISRPITMVSNQMNTLFAAIAGAERIFRVLDTPIETDDDPVYLQGDCDGRKNLCWVVPQKDGGTKEIPVHGDIRFHNVDFSYEPGKPILKNISLFAKPGQKIAFVGSTGAGKTTVTNLINRFYEIDNGEITFDGIPLNRIQKTDLRSIMSIVLQDVHLFEGTIAYNIRYGKLDATDEEVVHAAKLANAHEFITQLKDGYDTVLGPDGGSLSQGERQLLSIARAAIADPVVLILDEATSSVDTRTEQLIEKGMDELMEGRTTFVIAHRLSTVRRSNAILVLEEGEVVERGDHDDLMNQKGRYYDLNVGTAELE